MRDLVTADLHLNDNKRDRYRHDWIANFLIPLIRAKRVERLIILGDLTDAKNYHSAALTNSVAGYLHRLSGFCQVIVVQGNHDFTSPDMPFFEFTDMFGAVTWIKHPFPIDGCLFVPHTPESEWPKIEGLSDDWDWIFTHATFNGAHADNGAKLSGIPLSLVKGQRVISGDIHSPQTSGPVTYVGAPYTVDFGDSYSPRVLLLEGQRMVSIPSVGPQKVLIHVDSIRDLRAAKYHPHDMVKVRFGLPAAKFETWTQIRESIVDWAHDAGVVLVSVSPVPQVEEGAATERAVRIVHKPSDTQLVKAYSRRYRISADVERAGIQLMERGE